MTPSPSAGEPWTDDELALLQGVLEKTLAAATLLRKWPSAPAENRQYQEEKLRSCFALADALINPAPPATASEQDVERVPASGEREREAETQLHAALSTLEAYETDYGEPLPDDYELGRINESRGSASFRIRAGHIRRWARALAFPRSGGR